MAHPRDILTNRLGFKDPRDPSSWEQGWYHSFELPNGRVIRGFVSLEQLRSRVSRFPIPENLTGRRVLDIGASDGWFSFEMERRGAEVMAVDCVEFENFRYVHQQLGSQVDYRVLDVYELSPEKIGRFDFVLFLGVLYHLKHPLLSLEKVCALTKQLAIVDSFITDDVAPRDGIRTDFPFLEFYENDEMAGEPDNWVGPNLRCLLALCRVAGFARTEVLDRPEHRVFVACYRQWEPPPSRPEQAAPALTASAHNRNYGVNFDSSRDEYVTCWFTTAEQGLTRDDLLPEVGGYGVRPIFVGPAGKGRWQTNFKLPPGLTPGWHEVRLRTARSSWSNPLKIAVDLPIKAETLRLAKACDERTGKLFEVEAGDAGPGPGPLGPAPGAGTGLLTLWVEGLPANADRNNVRVYLGGRRLPVEWVSAVNQGECPKIQVQVPRSAAEGERTLVVQFGDAESPPVSIRIKA